MKRTLLTLLLILSATATQALANEVTGLRHSSAPGRVRLVLDTAEKPVYQVYTRSSPPRLIVEVLDTEPTRLVPGPAPTAGVIAGWKVEQPTLRRFRWVVDLDAPLPADRIKTMVLEEPHRLAVDLETTWEEEQSFALTEGVTWLRREVVGGLGGYLLWNELGFDPQDPHLRLDVGLGRDRLDSRETVSEMARRTGALAAVNGGFFDRSGGPLGVVVREGRILVPNVARRPPRTALGITKDRQVRFDQVAVRGQQLASRGGDDWSDVTLACGGGPRLLHRGRLALTTMEEQLGSNGNNITRAAGRTAVATTADGKMLLATGSGYRDNHSQGIKLEDLATLLLRRGAREAMNLDGGGSVTMVLQGRNVSNGPGCRTPERPVATALLLYDDRPAVLPTQLSLELSQPVLPADGQSQATVVARVQTSSGAPVADGTLVTFAGDGLVVPARAQTHDGVAQVQVTSVRAPGQARLRVRSGAAEATASLALKAGPLGRLVARLGPQSPPQPRAAAPASPSPAPSPAPALRQQVVEALAEDGWGNGLPSVPVRVAVDGKEVGSFPTDPDGQLRLQVNLPLQACQVVLKAGDLDPILLKVAASPSL